MKIFTLEQIQQVLPGIDLIPEIEKGLKFLAASREESSIQLLSQRCSLTPPQAAGNRSEAKLNEVNARAGFKVYSQGGAVVPPVGEMMLKKGEVHIKYGYLKEDEFYIIKIASGFYENPELGTIILGIEEGRTSDEQISVADLTGVAVQDIAIASAVFTLLKS